MTQEQAIKPVEIGLQEFLELIPDAFVLLDANGYIRRINAHAERLFGYTQADLCGQLIEILVPTRLRSAHAHYREHFTSGRRPMGSGTLPLLCKDGSEVMTEISLSTITTLAGERMFSAAVRDVRARRKAEEQIALQASLLAQIEDAVMAIDSEGRLFYWNRGAEKIFGWEGAEALGKTLIELFGMPLPGSPRLQAKTLLQSTGFYRGELQLHHKDRSEVCVDAVITSYRGARGDQNGFVGSFRDVTRRKEIEAEISAKREAISKLHDVSTQLVGQQALPILLQAVVNAAVTIAQASMGMIHVLDAASQSLQLVGQFGCTPELVEHLAHANSGTLYGEAMLRRQRAIIVDTAGSVSPGSLPALDLLLRAGMRAGQSTPIISRAGSLLGVVTTLNDQPYRPNELVLQALDLLAREAGELIESRQREAALQRAICARDQVLGVVAHDLRNPLNTILLRTQLLSSRKQPCSSESANAIARDALRMMRLIQDLLDISCIESGALSMEIEPIDVAKMVKEAVEEQQIIAASAQLTMQILVSSDLPRIFGDGHRLRQVFANLISNAIKFTPPGGRITVEATATDGAVLFRIADTGRGISADNLAHVFNRFWQADKAEHRGSGLGLAIVKGIIEMHAGRVWAESQPGGGSVFCFTLPAPLHDR